MSSFFVIIYMASLRLRATAGKPCAALLLIFWIVCPARRVIANVIPVSPKILFILNDLIMEIILPNWNTGSESWKGIDYHFGCRFECADQSPERFLFPCICKRRIRVVLRKINNPMDMIWHDDPFIQNHIWIKPSHPLPTKMNDDSNRIQFHNTIANWPKYFLFIHWTNCHEIPSIQIIMTLLAHQRPPFPIEHARGNPIRIWFGGGMHRRQIVPSLPPTIQYKRRWLRSSAWLCAQNAYQKPSTHQFNIKND